MVHWDVTVNDEVDARTLVSKATFFALVRATLFLATRICSSVACEHGVQDRMNVFGHHGDLPSQLHHRLMVNPQCCIVVTCQWRAENQNLLRLRTGGEIANHITEHLFAVACLWKRAAEPPGPSDNQVLDCQPGAIMYRTGQVCVMNLKLPEHWKLRKGFGGEEAGHVPIVHEIKYTQFWEAAAMVANTVEMIVMRIDGVESGDAAEPVKWQNSIDHVVGNVKVPKLGKSVPIVLWQWASEIVCAQEEPLELCQAAERLRDGTIQTFLMLPDLRHTEVCSILRAWAGHACNTLPWSEALRIGLRRRILFAVTGIAFTPTNQCALPSICFPQREQRSNVGRSGGNSAGRGQARCPDLQQSTSITLTFAHLGTMLTLTGSLNDRCECQEYECQHI